MIKVKIVHLLLDPNYQADLTDEQWESIMYKQNKSIECFTSISKYFYKYTQQYSKINRVELNEDNCADAEILTKDREPKSSGPYLSFGHYGAYMAHKNAILNEFSDDIDVLIIIEGDVVIRVSEEMFVKTIYDNLEFSIEKNASFFTFGEIKYGIRKPNPKDEEIVIGDYKKISHFLCCHTYAIMSKEKKQIHDKLKTTKWHAFDIWLFWNYDKRVDMYGLVEPIVEEPEGFSSIENIYK